jgi:LPXTG-site transpeptidase (sortase) family protein
MAGHVNYLGHGPAVFARLTELRPGDEIVLETESGRRFAYRVLALSTHEDLPAEVAKAVGPTEDEVVTLITCTGSFDRATGLYDRRLVVRAERV